MSDNDKMRAEFEAYLKKKEMSWLGKFRVMARQFFVAGYQAGRKAADSDLKNAIEDIIGEAAFEGLPESKQESLLRLLKSVKPEGEQ